MPQLLVIARKKTLVHSRGGALLRLPIQKIEISMNKKEA
jgi:hypothetical protein